MPTAQECEKPLAISAEMTVKINIQTTVISQSLECALQNVHQ